MAKGANKFYFDNFISAGECACRAAAFLADALRNFNPEQLAENVKKIHEIEHEGDSKKHEMSNALAKAFVTPIDREDLALISENIDNVTDTLEEILQRVYVCRIKTILPEALEFVDKLVNCCNLMTAMLHEFENFKRPAKLRELIIELNHAEEECDILYLRALLAVFDHTSDTLEIMFWREIFEHMEITADACENVGDLVETVVMKNT